MHRRSAFKYSANVSAAEKPFVIDGAGIVSLSSALGSTHSLHHSDVTNPKARPESSGLPDTEHTMCVC